MGVQKGRNYIVPHDDEKIGEESVCTSVRVNQQPFRKVVLDEINM